MNERNIRFYIDNIMGFCKFIFSQGTGTKLGVISYVSVLSPSIACISIKYKLLSILFTSVYVHWLARYL